MNEQLFYDIQVEGGICHIQFWFDHIPRDYTNEARVSFSVEPEKEKAAKAFSSWAILVESHRALTRLQTVLYQSVRPAREKGARDEVLVTILLNVLETRGCQVVMDERLSRWIRVSDLVRGDLWVVDAETMQRAHLARYPNGIPSCCHVETLAAFKSQARKEIVCAIAKTGEWNFLREWLDEGLPIIKDTTKTEPVVITVDAVRGLLRKAAKAVPVTPEV